MRTDIEQLTHDHPLYQPMLEFAQTGPDRHNYNIVSFFEGKFTVTEYRKRPCFGEMRPYNKTHPDEVKDNVSMPGDLNIRFPDGNPVAYSIGRAVWAGNPAIQFMVDSDESPFRSVFSLAEKVRNANNEVVGLLFLDLDLDPTLLVHGLRDARSQDGGLFARYKKAGATDVEAFVLIHTYPYWSSYTWSDRNNLKRVLEGSPINHSVNHKKYIDRAVYNRPMNEQTFSDGQNMIGRILNIPEFTNASDEGKVKVLRSVYATLK